MKIITFFKGAAGALALVAPACPASAQVLMLDFGPTLTFGANRLNSPYHSATPGFTDVTWNQVQLADISSGLLWSDNTAASGVGITLGLSALNGTTINLASKPATSSNMTGTQATTGIYAVADANNPSAVTRDAIFQGSGGGGNSQTAYAVGLEVDGLAAGTYDIYLVGRNNTTSNAHGQIFYAGKAAASGNFDFSGFASETLSYPNSSSPDWTAQNSVWQTGALANYTKFTITLGAGDVLQLTVNGVDLPGTLDELRGFMGAVQIVTVPEPSSLALLGMALGGLAFVRRRGASRA